MQVEIALSKTFKQSCGAGVARCRRFLGGVGVGFFLRLRKSNWIIFYIALLS